MLMKAESDRYLHQDVLRFIGAIVIVVAHYSEWLTWNGRRIPSFFIGGLGQMVDIFFFISGVIIFDIYSKRLEYRSFVRKRLARIAPLHLLILFLFVMKAPLAAWSHVQYHGSSLSDPKCIVPNITLTHAFGLCSSLSFNTPSWSISAEFGMYLLFPLALLVARRGWGIFVPLAMIGILTAWPWQKELWFYWNYDFGVLRALPSFFLGCWLANHRHVLRFIPAPRIVFWALMALYPVIAYTLPISLIVICYAIGAVAVAADDRNSLYLAPVAGLGRLAFGIYMLHVLVGSILIANLAIKVLHLHDAALIGFGVLTGLALIPISMVSLFCFEEPLRRFLSPKRTNALSPRVVTVP